MKKNILLFLWCFCWGIVLQAQSISSVVPSQNPAAEGSFLSVAISGNNTHFLQGSTTYVAANIGTTSITGYVQNISSDTTMDVNFFLPCNVCGTATLSVVNQIDGPMSYGNAFDVACAQILSLQPDTVSAGQTLPITISGAGMNFAQGSWFNAYFFNTATGESFQPTSYYNLAVDSMDVDVTIPNNSCGGSFDLCLSSSFLNCQTCLPNALYVNSNSNAQLTAVSPSTMNAGQSLTVGISGTGVDFMQGSLTISMHNTSTGQSFTVPNYTPLSATSLNAYVNVPSNQCDGIYDVCVSFNNVCQICLPNAVTINNTLQPQITSVSPDTVSANTMLSVNVSGTDINFQQATNLAFYLTNNSGVTVGSHFSNTHWTTPNQATAYFWPLPPQCGSYDLLVLGASSCSNDTLVYPNAVTVDALYIPAIYNTVWPATGVPGQQLTLNLSGGSVNFAQSNPNLSMRLVHQGTGTILQGSNITSTNALNTTGSVDFFPSATDCGTYNLIVDSLSTGCTSYVSRTLYNVVTLSAPGAPQIQTVSPSNMSVSWTPNTIDLAVTAANIDFTQVNPADLYIRNTMMITNDIYATSITPNSTNSNEATVRFVIPAGESGYYDMYIDNMPSCGANYTVLQQAFEIYIPVGTIPTLQERVEVKVYPNPMDQEATFEIKGPLNKTLTLNVYDMLGQVVRTEELITNSTATIQRQNLASGMYIYRILDASGQALKTGKIELR